MCRHDCRQIMCLLLVKKRDIPINGEIGSTLPTIHDENKPTNTDPSNLEWENTEIDYILNYENEYSQWKDRQ